MRQQHRILKRAIARMDVGLAREHVQPRERDLTGFQGGNQRIVIHQRAACGVGDDGTTGQQGDAFGVEPFQRGRPTWGIQRQHVTDGEEALVIVVIDGPQFQIGGQARAVAVMHLHVEAARHPRQRLTNAAHAENAQPLARHLTAHQLRRCPAGPGIRPHHPFALTGPAGGFEDKQHRQFSGGFRQHVRCVAHRNAASGGGGQIDVVGADAEGGNHPHPRGQASDGRCVQPVGRAAQNRVHILGCRQNPGGRGGGVGEVEAGVVVARGPCLHALRQTTGDEEDGLAHVTSSTAGSRADGQRARPGCCPDSNRPSPCGSHWWPSPYAGK